MQPLGVRLASTVGNKSEKKMLLFLLPLFSQHYYNSYCPEICTESIQNSSALPRILGNLVIIPFSPHFTWGTCYKLLKNLLLYFPISITHKSGVAFLMTGLVWIFVYPVFPLGVRCLWEKFITRPICQFIS